MVFNDELINEKQLTLKFKEDDLIAYNNNESIELQQIKMLKFIFSLLKFEMQKNDNNPIIRIKLLDGISRTDEGYYLLSELIEKTNFEKIADKYCLYFFEGEYDHHETFYYEIVWDYDTYIKLSNLNKKENSKKKKYLNEYKIRRKKYFDSKKY